MVDHLVVKMGKLLVELKVISKVYQKVDQLD